MDNCLKAWPHSRQVIAYLVMLFRQFPSGDWLGSPGAGNPDTSCALSAVRVVWVFWSVSCMSSGGMDSVSISAKVNSFAISTSDCGMVLSLLHGCLYLPLPWSEHYYTVSQEENARAGRWIYIRASLLRSPCGSTLNRMKNARKGKGREWHLSYSSGQAVSITRSCRTPNTFSSASVWGVV